MNRIKLLMSVLMLVSMLTVFGAATFATSPDEQPGAVETEASVDSEAGVTGSKAVAAAICIGMATAAGAIGMGMAISKSVDGIARQPEASSDIRTNMMLGLVFVETAIIYALIIAILIIFVL